MDVGDYFNINATFVLELKIKILGRRFLGRSRGRLVVFGMHYFHSKYTISVVHNYFSTRTSMIL